MGSDLCGACRRGDHYACRLFRCECPQDGCVQRRKAEAVRKSVRGTLGVSPKPEQVPTPPPPPQPPPRPVLDHDLPRPSSAASERVARPNQEFLSSDFGIPAMPAPCPQGHGRAFFHFWAFDPVRWYCCGCKRVYLADDNGLLVKDS